MYVSSHLWTVQVSSFNSANSILLIFSSLQSLQHSAFLLLLDKKKRRGKGVKGGVFQLRSCSSGQLDWPAAHRRVLAGLVHNWRTEADGKKSRGHCGEA